MIPGVVDSGKGEQLQQEAGEARLAERQVMAEMEEVRKANEGLVGVRQELEARLAEAGEETGRLRKVRGRQGSRRQSSDALTHGGGGCEGTEAGGGASRGGQGGFTN